MNTMAWRLFALLVVIGGANRLSAITIPTVYVGNSGNPADYRYQAAGVGSVPYDYQIGKTEVTNTQYVTFLNSVDPTGANVLKLFSGDSTDAINGIAVDVNAVGGGKYSVKPGHENQPAAYVYWFSALRFTNWLNNGQGNGDTETGAYTLLGGTPIPSNALTISRNPGAKWWLPSENEWYKAAYHKNDGVTGNYWDYPTSTNTKPFSAPSPGTSSPDPSNVANYFNDDSVANGYDDGYAVNGMKDFNFDGTVDYLTDVGSYSKSLSPYGTLDQAGNVGEWTDNYWPYHGGYPFPPSILNTSIYAGTSMWQNFGYDSLIASSPGAFTIDSATGFRVAGAVAVVPEPSLFITICGGALVFAANNNRRRV